MENCELCLSNGHVWFGKAADRAIFTPIDYFEYILSNTARDGNNQTISMCLRLTFRSEPMLYGKLGCQFLPNDSGNLTMKVAISNNDIETSGIGLPRELANVVFEEAVHKLTAENKLGSGQLIFDRAEFHLVDSNPYIFRLLINTILYLLDPENKHVDVQEINHFVTNLRQQTL